MIYILDWVYIRLKRGIGPISERLDKGFGVLYEENVLIYLVVFADLLHLVTDVFDALNARFAEECL